jgi:hypothetical protein
MKRVTPGEPNFIYGTFGVIFEIRTYYDRTTYHTPAILPK